MPFVVRPSRPGSIVAEAFRLKSLAERAEKKAPKEEPPDVHKKPAKASKAEPDVHKKAGKVHTTTAPPPRAKGGKTRSKKT